MRQDPLDSVWKRGHQREALSRHRMREGELRRMKRHPVEGLDQVFRYPNGRSPIEPPSVGLIAQERMPHRPEVNPDLVGAARLEPALEKRDTPEHLQHTEPR